MVSSTFMDLQDHRAVAISAIDHFKMHANVMERDDARLADVLQSSLQMVRESRGYVLVIGMKYGQVPECPERNPDGLSVTELEFNEALLLGLPILLFIMGEEHQLTRKDIEPDPVKQRKLDAFRERAKHISGDSKLHRVFATFNSSAEFSTQLGPSLADLRDKLAARSECAGGDSLPPGAEPIPKPPAFYAKPDYIGGHTFIGRTAQLTTLSGWTRHNDPANALIFEAIGGNGKSMLTWEWVTNPEHATKARPDWAGRFWYSFYEKGAYMRDFCQHALAYMTGRPLKDFEKKQTAEMKDDLLAQLHAKPWLLILDGLERVLVAYHRIDAAELRDEEVDIPTDKVLDRNPCDAIRDEDNDLLRALAAASPSKILISSRLIPRVLLSQSGKPIQGVRTLLLPGLDEADAELLLRSCDVTGSSPAIRHYLTTYCANHPLVIGVLAGLINSPGPHRGDFDGWAADPQGGAKLDLASLDLVQRRNHILRAALDALPAPGRQLLSTLALLSDAVDYETVEAFNPHIPQEPDTVSVPTLPEQHWRWEDDLPDEEKAKLRRQYETDLSKRRDYEKAMQAWRDSTATREAPKRLSETIEDLERRGMLHYDGRTRRYDLHPVVRGVASGGMKPEDRECYGRRVVDHFSSQPHDPYREAKTMEDVENGMHVVRTLLTLGHHRQAADAYGGDLSNALFFNLEAYVEALSLLRPFFPGGWGELPVNLSAFNTGYIANDAGIALVNSGHLVEGLAAKGSALVYRVRQKDWSNVGNQLRSMSTLLHKMDRIVRDSHCTALGLMLAEVTGSRQHTFLALLSKFRNSTHIGNWTDASEAWALLDPMGRDWDWTTYRPGDAERDQAQFQLRRGILDNEQIITAERLASEGANREAMRDLQRLRGAWRLEMGEWAEAAASFDRALTLARERRLGDSESETGLALAKHHLGQLAEPRDEAERLAQMRQPAHRTLARLWLAIGDTEQAKRHALAAYHRAWADGEPYVFRHELTKTTELLRQMNIPIPALPPYDPAKDVPFPWEVEVRAAIGKLRADKVDT